MKTNKKALMGMLVAMVMSIGILGGMQNKSQKDGNLSVQQIAIGCGFNAGASNSKADAAGWGACAAAAGIAATVVTGPVAPVVWGL